jgi:serine/threonine protein kinase
MHGRCSRASDVYAYGILLWELATNNTPFAGWSRCAEPADVSVCNMMWSVCNICMRKSLLDRCMIAGVMQKVALYPYCKSSCRDHLSCVGDTQRVLPLTCTCISAGAAAMLQLLLVLCCLPAGTTCPTKLIIIHTLLPLLPHHTHSCALQMCRSRCYILVLLTCWHHLSRKTHSQSHTAAAAPSLHTLLRPADVPQPLLGHCVISKQLRPAWPPQLKANPDWQGLLQLADLCWCHDPHMRCALVSIFLLLCEVLDCVFAWLFKS